MEKTVKELIEDIYDKLDGRETFDEGMLLDSIIWKFDKLENLQEPETLYFSKDEAEDIKESLKAVEKLNRCKNTSIDFTESESEGLGMEVTVKPTKSWFLVHWGIQIGQLMAKDSN